MIKNCPFCGSGASVEIVDTDAVFRTTYWVKCHGSIKHHLDYCADTEEEAVEVWNKRHGDAARIAELEAQLAAAQERNVALQSEHLNHVNALHEQLTAMTAERDSEIRWAKHYSDKVTELEQKLDAMQRIIDSYRRLI